MVDPHAGLNPVRAREVFGAQTSARSRRYTELLAISRMPGWPGIANDLSMRSQLRRRGGQPRCLRALLKLLKAIHSQENRDAADRKARAIVEDLRAGQMNTAADLVERSVSRDADLLRFSRHPLAEDPHQQPARTDHARDPSTDSCCRCIPRWPVVPQPRRGTIALHRGHRMVRQMLHEHAAALSAAGHANRSRRLIK